MLSIVATVMLLVGHLVAGNRPQLVAEHKDISSWAGDAISLVMQKSSDGVVTSRHHHIEILNGDNSWTIRVDCIRKEQEVYDAAGGFRGKHSYYEPQAKGFMLKISRKHQKALPNNSPKGLKRRKRDDGITELTGWVTSPLYPELVCEIWGLEGSEFNDELKGLVNELIENLETAITNKKKTEQDAAPNP